MRILASDLDGTLIRNNQISKEDLDALKKLKDNGFKIIVSTGRTLSGAQDILNRFKFEYDYLLLCNGGLIIDRSNKILHSEVINNDIKNGIINDFYDDGNTLMYYDNRKATYLIKKDNIKNSDCKVLKFSEGFSNKIHIDDALKVEDTYQMMSVFTTNDSIEYAEAVKDKILDKYSTQIDAFRNDCFVDIVPKGSSKGNGIKFIVENYEDIDINNVYTVGDSLNDISMFNITKNSYTFKNSEEIVKFNANNIIDNVYEVVEDMFK